MYFFLTYSILIDVALCVCRDWQYNVRLTSLRNNTERKVDSLNIYCENTLSQQRTHEDLFTFIIYSIPQN